MLSLKRKPSRLVLINILFSSFIFGTIYEIDENRNEIRVMNLNAKNTITKLTMRLGNFKIAFRTMLTCGSQ